MAIDEVDVVGINHQQVRRGVVKKEVLVRFDDLFDVVVADRQLPRSILAPQTFLQHIRTRLQINHKIRRGQLFAEVVVVAVINSQFAVVEVDAGEQLVFLEDVIADNRFVRTALERPQLLETPHQKGKLRLKGRPRLSIVEGSEKWIVLGLGNALCVQTIRNDARKRALAYSDRTFQGDVAGGIEELGHKAGLLGA